jgi:hypothetical protein
MEGMMKKFLKSGLAMTAALLLATGTAHAQEASKRDAIYYNVVLVDFKPGKTGAALKIIKDYFQKASDMAGTAKPVQHGMMTGNWDMMLIWTMEGGMADAEWVNSPRDLKWITALAELTGSQEKAMAKWQEYQSLVAKTTSAYSYVEN